VFTEVLGYLGLCLVFASFAVKRWSWLYTLNGMGAVVLAIYAYLVGNTVFTLLESVLAAYLFTKLYREYRSRNRKRFRHP